jgi:diaminopimelate decarboxylase
MIVTYQRLQAAGVTRFGFHTMLLSNELDWQHHALIAKSVFEAAREITSATGIQFEFINLGGGLGVPYRPGEHEFDVGSFAREIVQLYTAYDMPAQGSPRIVMENGRYVTADSGSLVTKVINVKRTHKTYVGVDASMSDLMRPGMYGAYHHISVLGEDTSTGTEVVDVTGSLCENNDKFAIDRVLPSTEIGDILAIHTTGAHAHTMGFQYNGKLRHGELLLDPGGGVREIRRAETLEDYFATLTTKGTYHVPTN